MADSRPTYTPLPGRRRGFIFSAGLWAGADHLLSVKSSRFQEEYKRFYFRDIQAIVVTQVPRFVVSAPVGAGAAILLTGVLILRILRPSLDAWLWLMLGVLAAVWLYLSIWESCICRLYTAVSREDLPSIHRMWTARRALLRLERRIGEVQGVFTENWAEAADQRALGPPLPAGSRAVDGARPDAARSRTWVSDIFLTSLLADAAITAFLIRFPNSWLSNVSVALTVVQIASAVWIFVQKHRGMLRTGMQRLAIVALIFIGGTTYAQMVGDAVDTALAGRRGPAYVRPRARSGLVLPIYSGGTALLAIAGFVLSFKPE